MGVCTQISPFRPILNLAIANSKWADGEVALGHRVHFEQIARDLAFLIYSAQGCRARFGPGLAAWDARSDDVIFPPMCGRIRLSSDVSEIKLVFSIPPHRPRPATLVQDITGLETIRISRHRPTPPRRLET